MNFEHHLITQALAHPATQPRDIIKQCYQAAYGAEHLLADMDQACACLEREFAAVEAADIPLYEAISDQVCRVNLAAWKYHAIPIAWLFRMFAAKASVTEEENLDRHKQTRQFLSYLDIAHALMQNGHLPVSFSMEAWTDALASYKKSHMTAVHHSDAYRLAEAPAYRIIRYEYVRLLPILQAVSVHLRNSQGCVAGDAACTHTETHTSPCVIAIDGRAASGKTTMADQLSQILDADVIRMDDFFLPPALRTAERLQTPGGNVHYERFMGEVLPHLHSREAFSYRRFDCHIMDYHGVRHIRACPADHHQAEGPCADGSPIRIVEGCYSHHPALGKYADITVFSHVEPEKQRMRILHRNGPQMAEMFRERWIPMEEAYIREYGIDAASQIRSDSTELF